MRTLRIFLLLLLTATLPLQGIASAVKASCIHAGAATALMPTVLVPDAGTHTRHVMDSADPSHHSMADIAAGDHQHQHQHAPCGVCANCCIVSFAPPLASAPALPQLASEVVSAFPSLLPASFIATGIDRPPKTIA